MSSSYPAPHDVTSPSRGNDQGHVMESFGLVQPFVISEDSPLSANARLTYCAMTLYAGKDRGQIWPSIATLMKHTALKRTALKAALRELETVGLAIGDHGRTQGHGGLAPTEYRLLDSDADRSRFLDDDGAWVKGG